MLDNFRKVGVVWNHSTNQIYQRMRVASSDDHGRKLVVQITNDYVLENTQEVELRLYWEIRDKKGFNDFTLIDAEHGIYEIYFSRGMLENKGTHKAWLHLTDSTGSVTSEVFGIEVFSGIDLEAVEGTDDFSALNSALARVVAIEDQEEKRQANENAREQAESSRVIAENTRKSAEETRESNEDERKKNENTRESTETARESAESTRQSNETNRQNAEANRQETFESNEVKRQSEFEENEDMRQSNEQTRQSQENTRQTNENSRQSEFEDMKAQVDDLEETYAPRLSEIEGRYIWFGTVEEI
jgi:flagellar biosynthesis GTPase FlhF